MPLFVVATPIGNLNDLSVRAQEALKEADLVACEDTRVTRRLLNHVGAHPPMISTHQHADDRKVREVVDAVIAGKKVVLVSDAGTPGVNDPGGLVVEAVLHQDTSAQIVPIPGPNAAVTLLSVSGFPSDRFLFLGFPPHKKGRETFFKELAASEITTLFYESPHRLLKALTSLTELCPNRPLVIGRELTKVFETIYRGLPGELLAHFEQQAPRGEFVCLLAPQKHKEKHLTRSSSSL